MPERPPTRLQAKALRYLAADPTMPPRVLIARVGVAGGVDNEAEFLYRLMLRGWLNVTLTPEGQTALNEKEI